MGAQNTLNSLTYAKLSHTKMRRLLPLFLLFLVSGCARAPQRAGVLHLAQDPDASTLDPAKAYDTTSIQWVRLLYRGLLEYDERANLRDEVAASHSIAPDGLTYTFKLRPDVRYTDGQPVVADDFRFAIERVLTPKTASDGSSFFENIVGAKAWVKNLGQPNAASHFPGIEVPDERTIVFHLEKPDATFLNNLTLPFAYAVRRDYVQELDKRGLALSENPLGCGPFKLGEWVHDGWLTLVKNPDYFHPDLPKCERIETRFGISASLQNMLYEQGSLDILEISDATAPDFLRLTQTLPWKTQVMSTPMMDIRYLAMNNEIAPFNDPRVRRALNYAVNRERIASYSTGRVTLARGVLPQGVSSYNPALKGYDFDPAKARALLQEAGYKDNPNAPIPLLFSTGGDATYYKKAALSIQADLKNVGMTVVPTGMRYSELKAKAGMRGANGSRLGLMGWIQDYPDPSNYLDPLFNSKSISDTASLNRSFYRSPRVDELLDAGIKMPPGPARLDKYRQAEEQIVADAPVVFLHHFQRYVVHQPWVKGYNFSPAWNEVYETVSVEAH